MAIRGTTPDYVLVVEGRDLTQTTVYVTIAQGKNVLTKSTGEIIVTYDGEDTTIELSLTQQETLRFKEGAASIQVKFIDETGYAEGTEIQSIQITRALLERVITYAAGD